MSGGFLAGLLRMAATFVDRTERHNQELITELREINRLANDKKDAETSLRSIRVRSDITLDNIDRTKN